MIGRPARHRASSNDGTVSLVWVVLAGVCAIAAADGAGQRAWDRALMWAIFTVALVPAAISACRRERIR